jgi:hypothetical protein
LIKTYEENKEDPLFLFGVTMQNHGGYTYEGENFEQNVSLKDKELSDPVVEQYLSLIYETDKAVEYLITYFQGVSEDVVILFFGDHHPKLQQSFYEKISGKTASTLDEKQKMFEVPFFIWANFDIEEEYIECVSLNYLSSYVYDVAGLSLPAYNSFLREMENFIPMINANGYYSLSNDCYLGFEEAEGDERRWLDLYEILQYNSIFGEAKRSDVFFSPLK